MLTLNLDGSFPSAESVCADMSNPGLHQLGLMNRLHQDIDLDMPYEFILEELEELHRKTRSRSLGLILQYNRILAIYLLRDLAWNEDLPMGHRMDCLKKALWIKGAPDGETVRLIEQLPLAEQDSLDAWWVSHTNPFEHLNHHLN